MTMNSVTLVGRLGDDPQIDYTTRDTCVCKFSLATNDGWGDNERTNWHKITIFGKRAESAGDWLRKGRLVGVTGRIEYNRFTGDDGVERFFCDIIANDWTFVGKDDTESRGSRAPRDGSGRRQRGRTERSTGQRERRQRPSGQPGGRRQRPKHGDRRPSQRERRRDDDWQPPDTGTGFSDDDIPF